MTEPESVHIQENHPIESPSDRLESALNSSDEIITNDDSTDLSNKPHLDEQKDLKDQYNTQFEIWKIQWDAATTIESKLELALNFMEETLNSGSGGPHFSNFWEARRLCLPLFKENVSSTMRSQLWNRFSDLSKEARRLKEILDEQSAFAVEQIGIAIQALEKEVEQFSEHVKTVDFGDEITFPRSLSHHFDIYRELQAQLTILNVQASRINALRKELLKTEMRVRQKNKFFQQLSCVGDSIFPKRKELIKQLSQQFVDDVNQFVKQNFEESGSSNESLYVLREEIKTLQSLAKVLTLNTHSFTATRSRLSECWDHIKSEEKERKKERAQQKVTFKQNATKLSNDIQLVQEAFEKRELPHTEVQQKIEAIVFQMRKQELGREELTALREQLGVLRNSLQEALKSEEDSRMNAENERTRQKKEKYQTLRLKIEELISQQEVCDLDTLTHTRDEILNQIQNSPLIKGEKQELERLLKPLRDIIEDKKEKELLNLSDNDRESLHQLENILTERQSRRNEIKTQLEVLRKISGASGLDFEKAMNYTAQMQEEKERLEKTVRGIKEIEHKIADMKLKIKN